MGVNLGCVPGGFGWIFPKRDHFNVGVGGWAHEARVLRARLHELSAFYDLPAAGLTKVTAHPMPVRRAGGPLVSGRMVLVGDAAGLVDPLTGEGIYAAIASGRLAASRLSMRQNLRRQLCSLPATRAVRTAKSGQVKSCQDAV